MQDITCLKRSRIFLWFIVIIPFCSAHNQSIKIVCTAALTPKNYEERKQQYIKSLSLLNQYALDPYFIESVTHGPTFLDEYCNHICYTQSNDSSLANYGINEAVSLQIGLKQFNFDPETIIIKLTGRYPLETDEFVRCVENNLGADVIVKTWDEGNYACTGLFAMRLNYFLDFLNNHVNYKMMEEYLIPLEHYFATYISKIEREGAKIVYLPKMYDYIYMPPPFLRTCSSLRRLGCDFEINACF